MAEIKIDQDYDGPGSHTGSIGERLRRAREAEGLTLEDVATQTRIPVRHLRNIEDERWEELPAVTYTVGFARSYANAVGLDGAEIGREVREQVGGTPRPQQVSPEFYDAADPARVPSRSLAWIAAILLVLLIAAYLIWRSQTDEVDDPVVGEPVAERAEQTAPPPSPQPQTLQPADLAGQPVTLRATDDVWFRVRNRGGDLQIEDRTLAAGEEFQVPPGFEQPVIQTGRPQALLVIVGGRELGTLGAEERTISDVSLLAPDLARRIEGQSAGAGENQGAGQAPAPAAQAPVG